MLDRHAGAPRRLGHVQPQVAGSDLIGRESLGLAGEGSGIAVGAIVAEQDHAAPARGLDDRLADVVLVNDVALGALDGGQAPHLVVAVETQERRRTAVVEDKALAVLGGIARHLGRRLVVAGFRRRLAAEHLFLEGIQALAMGNMRRKRHGDQHDGGKNPGQKRGEGRCHCAEV